MLLEFNFCNSNDRLDERGWLQKVRALTQQERAFVDRLKEYPWRFYFRPSRYNNTANRCV